MAGPRVNICFMQNFQKDENGLSISYHGIHQSLKRIDRGSCKAQSIGLPECYRAAEEWALVSGSEERHLCPKTGLEFSMKFSDYLPLCRKCHRRYDGNSQKMWDRDHAGRASKNARGTGHGMTRLTEEQILKIRERRASGEVLRTIAEDFGISKAHVSRIANDQSWRHLKNEEPADEGLHPQYGALGERLPMRMVANSGNGSPT